MKQIFRSCEGQILALFAILLLLCANLSHAVSKVELYEERKAIPPFELVTADGKPFTQDSFKGKWSLVTIGFTSCPDICPFVLSNLRSVTRELKESYQTSVDVVFVAVDPKRDREVLGDYVKHFGDNVIGVTGEPEELEKLAEGIDASFNLEAPDASGYYNVQHTAFVVLISPDGQNVARLNPPMKSAEVAEALSTLFISQTGHASR